MTEMEERDREWREYHRAIETDKQKAYQDGYKRGREDAIEEMESAMYHEAFEANHEKDGMQKWDSGNWIRYKLFENILKQIKETK